MYKSRAGRNESIFRLLNRWFPERMMILRRDVCTRRYLMSAEHEFSIRCEGQISGNGPQSRTIAAENVAVACA